MAQIIPIKKHLLVKRLEIIEDLKDNNYSYQEIGDIFNMEKYSVWRLLKNNEKLSDARPSKKK